MKQKILYIFTRTPLHVGAGASVSAIDQPVQRERHTGYPIIPGSAIKGVLADLFNVWEDGKPQKDEARNTTRRTDEGVVLFGLGASREKDDSGHAGSLHFNQASLLAFPVRSAKGCFAWLTSPLLLKRWARANDKDIQLPAVKSNKAHFNAEILGKTIPGNTTAAALFEDYLFHHAGEFDLSKMLASESSQDPLWQDLAEKHLVLISDENLSHFAQTACEVAQHVVIDDETGTAKEGFLFNQENVPAETLFFAPVSESKSGGLDTLSGKLPNPIQLGGDATTGLGFCTTNLS